MNGSASLQFNRDIAGILRKVCGVAPECKDRFSLLRVLLTVAVVAASYYVAVLLGLGVRFPGSELSVVWPSNALLLASLLLSPPARWWLFVIAVIPPHFLAMSAEELPLWRLCWQIGH